MNRTVGKYVPAFILLGFSIFIQLYSGNAGDKNWQLYAAARWLEGSKLYVGTFFDVNTPLLVWMYALPVALSHHLTLLKDYQMLVLVGLVLVAACIYLCVRVVEFHPEFAGNRARQIEFAWLLCFVMVIMTGPIYFVHREHIFMLLVLPYMFRWMPSVSAAPMPRNLRILIGSLAGIGFCLKPHCMVIWAGLQIVYIVQQRSWRILLSLENGLIYAANALYLLAIWYFNPEYLSIVFPMALATYGACNRRDDGIGFLMIAIFTFAVTFVDFRWKERSPYRQDIFYLLGACMPFFAYTVVNNGWGYTYNLLTSLILIATGWVYWESCYLRREYEARGLSGERFAFNARACLINFAGNVALSLVLGFNGLHSECGYDQLCKADKEFVSALTAPDHVRSFGSLSIEFDRWVRLSRLTGASWKTRFHHLWMLPKFIVSDEEFALKHQWIKDTVAADLTQDLEEHKPEVVFVDDTDRFYSAHKHLDLIPYFSEDPAFRAAWKHYRFTHSINLCATAAAKKTDTAKDPAKDPLKDVGAKKEAVASSPARVIASGSAASASAQQNYCKYDVYERRP